MENITEKKIKIARTKSGSPCLWESYSEFDNLKRAILIVNSEGDVKNSIFIRKSGPKQSLVPISEGDYIVKTFEDIQGKSISLLEVQKIANDSNYATLFLKYREAGNDITGKLEEKFEAAVLKARRKMEDPTYIASELFERESV